jgi:glucokinase
MSDLKAVAVDLGGTRIKFGLVNETGVISSEYVLPTEAEKGPSHIISQILSGIGHLLESTDRSLVSGVGLGTPGIVSLDGTTVSHAPNFADWEVVRLSEEISSKCGLRVEVENDANVAALGEARFGAAKGEKSFVMITLGTGVGGGIVLDGKIYRGLFGGAGEVGHITVDYQGVKCNCGGVGCLEAYVGQKYLSQRTADKLRRGAQSKIHDLVAGDYSKIEPLIISQAAAAGDQFAIDVLREMGTIIGAAMATLLNILDVRTIVIGGGVAGAGKVLFDAIEVSARSRAVSTIRSGIRIIPAILGNRAGMLGAASLVFQSY